jgi:hypothetical protein
VGWERKGPKLAARIPIYSVRLGCLERGQYRPRRSPDWLKMKNSTAPAIIYLSFT